MADSTLKSSNVPSTGTQKEAGPHSDDINSPTVDNKSLEAESQHRQSLWSRILYHITWTPSWCRWDENEPPKFTLFTNLVFSFAGAFTVANLYYNQPILNILAAEFGVSYEESSHVPTLAQSGYAAGLFFLCPLGDLFRRRPFLLCVIFISATMWIGLCITKSFIVFQALTFVTSVFTVSPQILLPLVGDLAPPQHRATALSIVTSGNVFGILIARILSGVVANYTSWRNIYWIAFALQYTILITLFFYLPDYPATNKRLNYFKMLWDVIRLQAKYPVLVQASLCSFCSSAVFTSFWTTLTFLLASPPYEYSPLQIGLFALIGLAGMLTGPIFARTMIDKYVPLLSAVFGQLIALVGVIIGAYTGTFTVAGPIIYAFLLDVSFMVTQVANRSAIYSVEPTARARINTSFMMLAFLGQITGTSAGNKLYAQGGWVASGSLSVAFIGFSLVVLLARGPWEEGWVGWHGGASIHKKNKFSADGKTSEVSHLRRDDQRPGDGGEAGGLTSVEKALEEVAAEETKEPSGASGTRAATANEQTKAP